MNLRNPENVMSPVDIEFSANAMRVLEARYLRRDELRHIIETPGQLFARVAGAMASAERLMNNEADVAFCRNEFNGFAGP